MNLLCCNPLLSWEMEVFGTLVPGPEFGEICTVKFELADCWQLAGYDGWFEKQYFIPLSEIDETTFTRNYYRQNRK